MNKGVGISLGTTDRRCPSPSSFPLAHTTTLPPCLGFPASTSSAATLPTLLSTTCELRAEKHPDAFPRRGQASTINENASRTLSAGPNNDFGISDPMRLRHSTSPLPESNFSATLPPPYITLPPLSIPHSPQTLHFSSTKPKFPLPPQLPHPEDLRRMKSSQPASGGPTSTSNNSDQSPIGWRSSASQSRRNSGLEITQSRRSSQASAHPSVGSVEGSRLSPQNPTAIKAGPTPTPPTTGKGKKSLSSSAEVPAKSRRVRTGCLTCRERHLKCDESVPDCLNCRKGGRECKRGLRLNFIDIQIKPIPFAAPALGWTVSFVDESRLIASEYAGGINRYPPSDEWFTHLSDTKTHEYPAAKHRRLFENIKIPDKLNDGHSGSALAFPVMPSSTSLARGLVGIDTAPPIALTQERIQALPLSSIGINEEGVFGLVPIKEGTNGRACDSLVSDSSSIASSMVPQIRRPSSTTPFRAEMKNSSGGVDSRNKTPRAGTTQPRDALPDTLPTPPSEKVHGRRETGFGIVRFGDDFSDHVGEKEYLSSPDEILYMQVFMEKVGIWMDSLDKNKHFSRLIPFLALKSPMLLNAFLACGVKHLTLIKQASKDDKALLYYDTATTQLLRNLQNPDRNITECATTAVVLNVYEIMSEKPNDRMSHIAGARALIRECGWNAQSEGVGAACFWLNIGMEVLGCLSFNWPTAWDPDHWGLDLGFVDDFIGRGDDKRPSDTGDGGGKQPHYGKRVAEAPTDDTGGSDDEVWTRRMLYIVAKIANFRANTPRFQEPSPHVEQLRLQNRFTEWKRLKSLCDGWNRECPRSMKPFGYLYAAQSSPPGSVFPNVWLVRRAAVIGRLLYHTAMILLHQTNPIKPSDLGANQTAQLHHAHQVCGIVAHTKDGGISSVAVHSLVIAALVLRNRCEQDEVTALFNKIAADTGFRTGKVYRELLRAWKRADDVPGAASSASPSDFGSTLAEVPTGSVFGDGSRRRSVFSSRPGSSPNANAGLSRYLSEAQPIYREYPSSGVAASSTTRQLIHTPASSATTESSGHIHMHPTASVSSNMSASAGGGMSPSANSSPGTPGPTAHGQQQVANPLLRADFSLPDHPYKAFYKRPSETTACSTHTT